MSSSVEDPFAAFPEAVRQDIDGLIWLGYLEETFSWCGHDFVVRTLRGDEELLAGLVMKDFTETVGQGKAHVWATIALALVAVDGAEDFCPPASPNKKDYARARFQWVTTNWFWPLALFVYNKYTDLLRRQQEALDALEDFCAGSPLTDLPSLGSLTDRASSEEDIRDFLEPQDDSTPSA